MAGLSVDNVLALRQTILQRNNAIRDAVGGAGAAQTNGAEAGKGVAGGPDFASALKGALNEVNNLQARSSDITESFERGDTTDIATVMLARQQASIGFETTLQVRNKLLSAYKDIMSMPV
jgi:flagellar hook-basal body complex protein FliE